MVSDSAVAASPDGSSNAVIPGAYLHDILEQPASLQRLVTRLAGLSLGDDIVRKLRSGEYQRIVLTGMGSSFWSLYPLHLRLSDAGLVSHWLEASEFLLGFEPLYRKDTLLVAVSQSGESGEIVRLLERREEFGHVIGVTNDPASHLGTQADTALTLDAGPEATVSCKTYVATLATLHWLGGQLLAEDAAATNRDLESAVTAVGQYLDGWQNHVAEIAPLLKGVRSVFVTGRRFSLTTAGTGGLILKEATRQHAEGMSCPAFRHGPLEMAGGHVLVLLFAGTGPVAALNRRLAGDIERGGAHVAVLATADATSPAFQLTALPEAVAPIAEILPVQMLSLALAARDRQEAGRFERACKITSLE